MPRIRDALRKADLTREQLTANVPAPRAFLADEPARGAEESEEIHFIEVGGGRGRLEGSPSVLASLSQPAIKSRNAQHKAASAPAQPIVEAAAHEEAPAISSVAFLALPREISPPARPQERFSPEVIALHQPDHPLSEQYRALVSALAAQLPAGQPQVLLFTAAIPGIDAATVTLNLGVTWAEQGKCVAIVDANTQQAAVAEQLGLSLTPGLCDVLAGTASLQRAVQETGLENLYALTAGRPHEGQRNPLTGQAMRSVLRHLRARYDWVLVTAARWDGRPDVVALGSACDAVYLVLPAAEAQSPEVEDLLQLIPQQGSQLRGCIYTGR